MSLMFGSAGFVIAGVVVLAIVVALVVGLRRKGTDWAGDPRPPQQPPRSIDDTQRFREQNRPTDPPEA